MFQRSLLLACLILVIATTSTTVLSTATPPSGCYHGSYFGSMIKGDIVYHKGSNKFDLKLKAFDKHINCLDVRFDYHPDAGGMISLPNAKDRGTCIGELLVSNNLQAKISYNAKENNIDLNVGVARLTLKHQKC